MRRNLSAGFLALLILIPTHSAAGTGSGIVSQEVRSRQVVGEPVVITLENEGTDSIPLDNPWKIRDVRSDEEVAYFWFTDEQLTLDPGEVVVWEWNQDDGCYGNCVGAVPGAPGLPGDPVGPSAYQASLSTRQGMFVYGRGFRVGQYFTIGFEGRPRAKFVTYVTTPDEVAQMEEQAAAVDKTLIVSGIVRRPKRYNRDWNFIMGPASVVLGEVFIEVCDGSPFYVQRHRSEWLGKRWCPWSSYVEKVGR